MARAVEDIVALLPTQNRNPMLASKLLGFFFPDFFPVWDTAWVSKALNPTLRELNVDCPSAVEEDLPEDSAALAYATYVHLKIADAAETGSPEYGKLERRFLKECQSVGYSNPRFVLSEFFSDLTPILFEASVLGRAAKKGYF